MAGGVWARTFVNDSKIRCSSALFLGKEFYDVPNLNHVNAVYANLEIWRENLIFDWDVSWNNDKCFDRMTWLNLMCDVPS